MLYAVTSSSARISVTVLSESRKCYFSAHLPLIERVRKIWTEWLKKVMVCYVGIRGQLWVTSEIQLSRFWHWIDSLVPGKGTTQVNFREFTKSKVNYFVLWMKPQSSAGEAFPLLMPQLRKRQAREKELRAGRLWSFHLFRSWDGFLLVG